MCRANVAQKEKMPEAQTTDCLTGPWRFLQAGRRLKKLLPFSHNTPGLGHRENLPILQAYFLHK